MRGCLVWLVGLAACAAGDGATVAGDGATLPGDWASLPGVERFGYACWSTRDFGFGAVRFNGYQASTGALLAEGWLWENGSLDMTEEWDRRADGQPSAYRYADYQIDGLWHGHVHTYDDDVLVRIDFDGRLDGVFDGGEDYRWRPDGQLRSVKTDHNGDGVTDYGTTYSYDDLGRPLERVDFDDDGPYLTAVYEWTDERAYTLVEHLGTAAGPPSKRLEVLLDAEGRTIFSEEDRESDGVWDTRNTTEFGVDYMRNVREVQDDDGSVTTWDSEEIYDGWKTIVSSSVMIDPDGTRTAASSEWTWGCD